MKCPGRQCQFQEEIRASLLQQQQNRRRALNLHCNNLFSTVSFQRFSTLRTSDVVWDRRSGTRPVWDQKSVLVFMVLQVWCCHDRHHNDLEGHSNFSSRPTIYSFSILCLEHHYCGDQQSFTYLKVKSARCLCLLPVFLVLVLRIWSCLHHCYEHVRTD